MLQLRYSKRSRTDLEAIWNFIATSSEENAEAVLERLYVKIEQLRSQPLKGHRRDDLRRGIRCVNSDGFMVFYRCTSVLVRVDRIIHHSRHLPDIDFELT